MPLLICWEKISNIKSDGEREAEYWNFQENVFTLGQELSTYLLAWDFRSTFSGLKNVFICFLAIFVQFP